MTRPSPPLDTRDRAALPRVGADRGAGGPPVRTVVGMTDQSGSHIHLRTPGGTAADWADLVARVHATGVVPDDVVVDILGCTDPTCPQPPR